MSAPDFDPRAFAAPRYWPTWLALGLLRALSTLPLAWQFRLGSGLGLAMHFLHRPRRHIARRNVDACFPDLDAAERTRLVRETFRHTGISVIETGLAWWGDPRRLQRWAQVEGLEHLHAALAAGRGAIVLTGHSTALEIGGRLLGLHIPMQVMFRNASNRLVDAVALVARTRNFGRVLRRRRVRETLRGLQDNLPTWYAPDQDFGRKGTVFVPFMGVPASTLLATARLAQMSGAAVVPYFPYRLSGARGYRLVIQPALEGFPSDDPVADARRVNEVLAAQIAEAPAQYMWVHRRFKTRPPGAPPIY